jgi:hypothetical protein
MILSLMRSLGSNSWVSPVLDRWSSAWSYAVAALLLGGAIQLNLGMLSTGAILLVSLALVACGVGLMRPRWKALRERNVVFAIGLALVIQIGLLVVWPPGTANALQDPGKLIPFRVAMVVAGIIGVSLVIAPGHSAPRLAAVVAIYLLAGVWVISLSPNPPNDVWYVQQAAGHALMHGQNPYAVNMPNIYGPDSGFYAPSIVRGDVLDIGFPYPPLSLLIVLPGVLLGDARYALLAASATASVVMTRIRGGPVGIGAGLLLLLTPRTYFLIEQAWTEPVAVLLLAVLVFAASRESRLTTPLAGLLAVVKQYMPLALPLAVLMAPRPIKWMALGRAAGVAIGAALIVTVPLIIWNAAAFWHSVVEVQFLQPSRADALAYPAWLMPQVPWVGSVAGFLALGSAIVLIVWRAARTPAGFAGATAFAYFAFFAFNRQAFANYYYFVIGALCIAVAATSVRDGTQAKAMSEAARTNVGPQ